CVIVFVPVVSRFFLCFRILLQHRSTLFPYTTLFRSDRCTSLILLRTHYRRFSRDGNGYPIDNRNYIYHFRVFCSWRYIRNYWSRDRKSTRLNSSHVSISYAVFCLKKKIDELRSEELI